MKAGRRWPKIAAVAVLVIAVLGAVAFARQSETATEAARSVVLSPSEAALAPPGATVGVQRGGGVLAWLASTPAQPVRGEAGFDAYLVDSSGQPIADALVTFDTDMTNMSHGPNLVKAKPTGNGHYTGLVRFQMPGPWRTIVVIERAGQDTVRLRFEFPVNFR